MKGNLILDALISKVTFYLVIIATLLIFLVILNPKLLLLAFLIFVFTVGYAVLFSKIRKNEIEQAIANLTFHIDSVTKDTLLNFQMPLAIIETDGEVIWSNSNFENMFLELNKDEILADVIGKFKEIQTKFESKSLYTELKLGKKIYDVYGNIIRLEHKNKKNQEFMLMMYFLDKTEYVNLTDLHANSSLCVGVISIDNFEELIQTVAEDKRSQVYPIIGKFIRNYISKASGIVIEKDRDKFIVMFEKGNLKAFKDTKFELLEDVKKIDFGTKVPVTLSGAITADGQTIYEKYDSAFAALDVALGRGGDQIVLKEDGKFEFFGGKSIEVEKRTKVKTRVVSQALKELIQNSKNVIIMGHIDPDIDVLGAGMGLHRFATTLGKESYIVLDEYGDSIRSIVKKISAMDKYSSLFIKKNEAKSKVSPETLLIVVDTHKQSFVECKELLNETDEIVIIDHHRRSTDIIENPTLSFCEVYASSTCELISEILQYSDEDIKLEAIEAECMYAGIMIDTKNFTVKAGVRTFEAAAYLRKNGADISAINQMFKTDWNTYVTIADIVKNMEVYHNTTAISVCPKEVKNSALISAQAADEILYIDSIQASFVLSYVDNTINISARSVGTINVQVIMEKLGGGGHINMAGAQIQDSTMEQVIEKLKEVIGESLKTE